MPEDWTEAVRTLLEAPSAAVLTTYRRDGSALLSPVWFRWASGVFKVVIARGDVKLRHLAHDRRCGLVIFETVPPGSTSSRPWNVTCRVWQRQARLRISGQTAIWLARRPTPASSPA